MHKLLLEDGTEIEGKSFGAQKGAAGEVVFSTGMVGYPESFTDPSYMGQILILTYPIIGNYGVPEKSYWESESLKITGLIVSSYIDTPSHFMSTQTLGNWMKTEGIPGLEIKDTRYLAQKLRDKGTMLGKIVINQDIKQYDPNKYNLVREASTKKMYTMGKGKKKVLLIDCGAKNNIARCLIRQKVEVIIAPWDFDPFAQQVGQINFDAIVISNGPGDPKTADKTIQTIQKALKRRIPILGICLGHQLLSLAAGGDTQKLKYGHRSQNQPCIQKAVPAGRQGTKRCYITAQNHGFAVNKIPPGFKTWFFNANDGTNEGIIHESLPFMSVQFHPEATPGPTDTEWIFDYFLERTCS